jgi:hypothetical protein
VPAYYKVMSGIAVGVPGRVEDVPPDERDRLDRVRRRRPLSTIAHGDRWGVAWRGAVAR